MITGLPADIQAQIDSKSRKPIQLLQFHLPDAVFYLSDIAVGKGQGLDNDYQPWIESWGTLRDNTNLTNVFEGNSLEIRSGTITLLSSNVSSTFVKLLFQAGVENIRVILLQWFGDITSPPIEIDTMVCQDPISLKEASMLLKIDIVSVLMKANPYLWENPPGVEPQPIVVGKAVGMPLKNLQTARVTAISEDIPSNFTTDPYDPWIGTIFIENGVGFEASGIVSIDSEDMAYDTVTASSITITSRAQNSTALRPHLRGALMCPYGAVYDYVICSGPVASVDNLLGNSEAYVNDVELFPGQDPVIARFTGRPPWLKVSPGQGGDPIQPPDVTLPPEYGNRTEQHYGNTAGEPTSDTSINSGSGSATLAISQHTAGGTGILTGRSSTETNTYNTTPSVYYPTKLTSNRTSYLQTNTGSNAAYQTQNAVSGSVDHVYHHDDSAYGSILHATVRIRFNTCGLFSADGKMEIFFVNPAGDETFLAGDELLLYDDDSPYQQYFVFSNVTFSTNVSSLVTNFADLALCSVRIRYTNIRTNFAYVTANENAKVQWNNPTWDIGYDIPAGVIPSPYQELVSHFNRDLSSLGAIVNVIAKVYLSVSVSNATVNASIVKRSTSNSANDSTLWSQTLTSSLAGSLRTFSLGSMSWAELQSLRIGAKHQITGPNTADITRASTLAFSYVQWEIEYTPVEIETPDEVRVVYAETMTCDVTSMLGENPTPPQVVNHMITDHSDSGAYIDTADFTSAHDQYVAAGYYLNGVLPAGTKLHEALREVLKQGMCRLLFNQSLIKIITYFEQVDKEVDFTVSDDDVQLRSKSIDNQPTANIRNDITVSYNKNYVGGVYDGQVQVENAESIARFFRNDYRRELSLINNEAIATLHANRLLDLQDLPTSIYSFNMFIKAYVLEKGDKVKVKAFLDDRFSFVGNIMSMERIFGQGKTGKINLFKVSLSDPESIIHLELADVIEVDDNAYSALKGLILRDTILIDDAEFIYLKEFTFTPERLVVVESLTFEKCQVNGYGTCGYGVHGYGK